MVYIRWWRKIVVERAVLLKEIDSLPPRYYGEVVDFVGYIKEKKAKETFLWKKPPRWLPKNTGTTRN